MIEKILAGANIPTSQIDIEIFSRNMAIASYTSMLREKEQYAVPVFQEHAGRTLWTQGVELDQGIEIALLDIPVIDTTKLTWPSIKEIKDELSNDLAVSNKLRRFRMLLDDIDLQTPKAKVQDMICLKVEEHENAIKEYGLKTRNEPLKFLLRSKSLPKFIAGGIFSLFGFTSFRDVIDSTEVDGLVQEVGDLAISVDEKKIMKGIKETTNGVEYLAHIRRKIERES